MRTITLNAREARMLRTNLVTNQEGYDFLDLVRLDHLAKKLTGSMGDYAQRLAELTREEKQARRALIRAQSPAESEAANRTLLSITYEVEDLDAAAELTQLELRVEDGDYKLIADKLANVTRWQGHDEIRHVIIGMVGAVQNAAADEPAGEDRGEVRRLKRA